MKNGPKTLLENEDHLRTSMGAWFPGERVVFRGKDLHKELANLSWMGLLLYGITGRLFNKKQIELFEGMWVISTSYPDPRLWNNRVAALAGTVRSTANLAMGAAIAVSEATIYGQRPAIRCTDFFYRTKARRDSGASLKELVEQELKTNRNIYGYGRPIVNHDERITPMMSLARDLGFADGDFVKLAFEVEDILQKGRWRLQMNIAALLCALAADQGLTAREYYSLMTLCFTGGVLPCYLDALNKPEGSFYPIRCTSLEYQGTNIKTW